MVNNVHTLIIGAGASGLFCAFQLAKKLNITNQTDQTVMVIDHAKRAGSKILMSGGGKCNFTNYFVSADNYLCSNPHFCKSALARYTNWDFIALVEKHGIAYEERKHGQLFCEKSSKDILNLLLNECASADVNITLNTSVTSISAEQSGFLVTTNNASVHCQHLVIATGGLSIPTMKSSGFGYDIAQQFGHELLERRAGLVPFTLTDSIGAMVKNIAGNAIDVSATANQQSFSEAMLYTHRGLSGPAMLQASNYWHVGDAVNIDLLPSCDVEALLLSKKLSNPKVKIRSILGDLLPKNVVLGMQSLYWQDMSEKSLADIADVQLKKIADHIHNWQVKPSGTEGYRTAEVTLGGVDVQHISSKTMQSQRQDNLYFIGEVLDVTGWLGGYNFQWAWSSAYACADAISNQTSAELS